MRSVDDELTEHMFLESSVQTSNVFCSQNFMHEIPEQTEGTESPLNALTAGCTPELKRESIKPTPVVCEILDTVLTPGQTNVKSILSSTGGRSAPSD